MMIRMGGKRLHKVKQVLQKPFRAVRTWQLILIFIPLLFFTATLLRFDHLQMVHLRDAVLDADAAGDEEEITQTLTELRDFVYSHTVINISESNGVQSIIFGTGPFYLEQSYRRAANAAIEEVSTGLADDSNPNGNIYAAVSAICQPLAIQNGWQWSSQGYLDCWTSELAKYPESDITDNQLVAKVPSTGEYRRDFSSPIFSWTPAGVAIVVSLILGLIIIIRIIIWCVLKIALVFLKSA